MVDIYDDHEQSERVRKWIKENGGAMVLGVVLAFGGLYGWKYWQAEERRGDVQAATEYYGLATALDMNLFDKAYTHFEAIRADSPKSTYNAMAHLMIARARLDQGQADLAESLYRDLLSNTKNIPEFIQLISRERLARLLLAKGDANSAMEVLDQAGDTTSFEARFAEVRGDILAANGDADGARSAYAAALDAMVSGTGDRSMLELKRDNPIPLIAAATEDES